jgi:UDP-N-acetylglucosamine 2-epimerase (non-hydrolysing)
MIDSFEMLRARIEEERAPARLGLTGPYAMVTLHRPSNVDAPEPLAALVQALLALSRDLTVVFAVHPRTRRRLEEFGLLGRLAGVPTIRLTEPLSYIEFMSLVMSCTIAITDSGGVQEETTYLGIPCATLRENTERPITLSEGTNRLLKPPELAAAAREALTGHWPRGRRPALWDGHTAQRAAASLHRRL